MRIGAAVSVVSASLPMLARVTRYGHSHALPHVDRRTQFIIDL